MTKVLSRVLILSLATGCTAVLGIDGSYGDQADGGVPGIGGGTGATSGTGGGTGGVSTGNEVCDNGKDDDGDGKIDCEDPDCVGGGFSCVDPIPAGFVGPVAWTLAAGCGAPFGVEHAKGGPDVSAPPGGTCPTCSCGSASAERCGVDAMVYDQTGCAGNSKLTVFVGTGTCLNVGDQAFGPKSVKLVGAPKVVQGSCAPGSSGQKAFQNPSFSSEVRACLGQLGSGCGGGKVCAPPSSEGSLCVAADGDVPCPGGFSKRLLYRSWQDGRDCTPCTCSKPTGSCPSTILPSLFDPDSSCGSGEIPLSSSCKPIPIHPSYGTYSTRMSLFSPTGVTCEPEGGAVSGGVTPSDPVTVCCKAL